MRAIWDKIDEYFSRDERRKIEELKKEIDGLKEQLKKYKDENTVLNNKLSFLNLELKNKDVRIRFLESMIYGDDSKPPKWLDQSRKSYQPRREILRRNGKLDIVVYSPKDLYVPTPTLVDLVYKNKWHELEHDEKLMKIWAFVIRRLKYQYDRFEDWRHPVISYNYRKGDCEDGTILFVTLCRIAGVPADSVFNACGWFHTDKGKFGHSFPIAKMENGKWYVFETTIDVVLPSPVLFKGSRYNAEWGVHNWKFDGRIKKEYKQKDGKYQV